MSRARFAAAGPLLAALASSCTGAAGGPDCGQGEPVAFLRAGYSEPMPRIEDGARVYVRCGGQGLRHIEFELDLVGFTSPATIGARVVAAEDGTLLGQAPRTARRLAQSTQGCESPEFVAVIESSLGLADLSERVAVVEVSVSGRAGHELALTRQVVIDTTRRDCAL